ncbi:tRNA glutamyl-Q(34) synthetase GluQRS [Acidisarcina polymorpha]|uniref:tRNA glutamyl-Q(34) synthetase GluQRS n=1 Tax=Acidisarcina polymorpha TaxID=2211140 RepID=UPI001F011305|nr:tRNA glutamyl-Q(34) synthetase GluQRS [Acidisarcina polymorpha]
MSDFLGYRGRLAPSPTGLLHLGHAATFWTAYQRALRSGGALVLRVDDLDPQRSKPEFAAAAVEDLDWLGIRWQEGPDVCGEYGPYLQSMRLPLYISALKELIEGGFVYPCRCSRKDLTRMTQAPHDEEPLYPGTCRATAGRILFSGFGEAMLTGLSWRFRVRDGEAIEFSDGHFGRQRFVASEDFGDFLIWRKDGVPAYQLAVAVDDAAMKITEVVRGADLLKATARQILVCRALGLPEPAWFHCPLITDEHGRRLAKRHDALSIRELRASGMKPEDVLGRAAAKVGEPNAHRGPDL